MTVTMDFEERVRAYAGNLVNEATGGDAGANEELSDAYEITPELVVSILRQANVPMAQRLLSDIDLAFEGEEPRYFIPHDRIVERYREHHHPAVNLAEPDYGIQRMRDSGAVEQVQQVIEEIKLFGISLDEYRDGAACVAEQKFFYDTDEWKDRAAVIRIIDQFRCRECGRRGGRDGEMLHVHHDEHIISFASRQFYRNFDVIRLRCLCEACHSSFHETHTRGYSQFSSAEPEEILRNRRYRAALERLHDALRECQFCFPRAQRAA
jgi:5-methylcytosine-specific restriction endonuclease McrA